MQRTLAFDIGNTNITIGVFHESDLVQQTRLSSDLNKSLEEYKDQLSQFEKSFQGNCLYTRAVIGSVVPALTTIFSTLLHDFYKLSPIQVGIKACAGLKFAVPNPESVGADRIANVVAASRLYSKPALVIDFGTATTFDLIAESGEFEGGIIAVGPKTSMQALVQNTAMLSDIELVWPESLLGKTTQASMQSGLVRGYLAMVDGLIEQLQSEGVSIGEVVATGGLGRLFAEHSKYIKIYNPDLTLIGLRMIAEEASL